MLPKHKNPENVNRTAFAPYNFVPLPDRVISLSDAALPDQDIYDKERFSGVLECRIETASPIYIRCARDPHQKEQEPGSDFFFIADENVPVIPGSSLRGMFRSLVEVATFSKPDFVTDKKMVYRSVGGSTNHAQRYRKALMQDKGGGKYAPLMIGGYIHVDKNGEWYIQPAKVIGGTSFSLLLIDSAPFSIPHTKNASEIYINTGPYEYHGMRHGSIQIKFARVIKASKVPAKGLRKGVLAKSGRMGNKEHEAVIYEEDNTAAPLPLSDLQINLYQEQISKEQRKHLGTKGVLVDGHPVFYILDSRGKVKFFGHCRMFRLPYPKSPKDLLEHFLPSSSKLDLAESIFGTVSPASKNNGQQEKVVAGRLNFSDGTVLPEQTNLRLAGNRVVVPKILASPKPTTFQHYLVQQTPDDTHPVRLSDYSSNVPLRGNKFYWHKGDVTIAQINEPGMDHATDSQHTEIQPLRSGVKFKSKLHFENLSLMELGALLWIFQIGNDPRYRFKLGMGKPLGMGAISIHSKLFFDDRQKRYRRLFSQGKFEKARVENPNIKKAAIEFFEKLMLERVGGGADTFSDIPRIKELLILLSWPGPDESKTQYMQIRPDNEYKQRPVLPAPSKIHTPCIVDSPGRRGDYQEGSVLEFKLGPNHSYGFIQPATGEGKVFVHVSQLRRDLQTLEENQKVRYKLIPGRNGLQAGDVHLM